MKANEDELLSLYVKAGDLEVRSIGCVYNGPWEKKYWSSSRGKHRHPYPVGYKAVRTHKGITFDMEIHSGPRGPLFSITSSDGHSFSGLTPDLAWRDFHKKSSPLVKKVWHGNRFSGGIDGTELFGFNNKSVQRLFRQLEVNNIDAKYQKTLESSETKKTSCQLDFIESQSQPVTKVELKNLESQDLMLNGNDDDDDDSQDLSDNIKELIVQDTNSACFENGECDMEERHFQVDHSQSIMMEFSSLIEEISQNLGTEIVDHCSPGTLDSVQAAMQIKSPPVEEEEAMDIDFDIVIPDSQPDVLESDFDVISDLQKLSASHAVIKDSEDISCHEKPCPTSTEIPEKSHKHVLESVLGCLSPCKNNLPRDIWDACANTITGDGRSKNSSMELLSKDSSIKTDHFGFCSTEPTSALKSQRLSSSQDKTHQTTCPEFVSNNVASVPNVGKGGADCNDDLFVHGNANLCSNKIAKTLEVENNFDESQDNVVFSNGLCSFVQLVGCYYHPMPVLTLLLREHESEIYICVICGSLKDKEHTLYAYKLAINGQEVGKPSFVGQTSLIFPHPQNYTFTEMLAENYGLQFSPDCQSLILLDKIKTPTCRRARLDCLCSTCTSECYEENTLKIVKVQTGYVSVTAKLKTADKLDCILVCEPSHLIAGGESGRLHLWTMNSSWSAHMEEFSISANCGKSSRIVELKRIPNYASLVISQNGCGEFCLWDISKQILLSVFFSPSPSVSKFFPIGLFYWQKKAHAYSDSDKREPIHNTKKSSYLEYNKSLPSSDEEHSAISLLVSTSLTCDDHDTFLSNKGQVNSAVGWRLGLLANNMMITGSTLEPRAAVMGTSAGYGIAGTREGVTYMWELSTGVKLGALHNFKGGSASCIATDDSSSGVFAVGGDRGQLLVYLIHPKTP
ncbi:hypothetical protein ACFE04_026075 [Oxalis oulophora]